MYAVQMASCGDIVTKFHNDWYRRQAILKILSQKSEAVMLVLLMGGIYDTRR
jgi:hypothetical protein